MGVFASCHQSYRHMPGTALITETHARKSPHLELLGEENFVGTLPFLYALRFCFRNWLALVPIQHSHSAELDKARGSNSVYFASYSTVLFITPKLRVGIQMCVSQLARQTLRHKSKS